jgi:hypothetical protein
MLLAVLSIVGCTTEVDYSMGAEFVPTDQNMTLKRRVYELGKVKDGDTERECALTTTRLYQTDSILSSNIRKGYFGCEHSDIYGTREAGFMSQMVFSLSLPEGRGWGYRPIYDSMLLSLYITDYHGDTTQKYRFAVYEIISIDWFNLPEDKDTTFFINFDPTPYISAEPIFEFTFPDQEREIYVGDMSNPKNSDVRLESTPATAEYISRLMLTNDLDDEKKNGLALDLDGIYVDGNEAKFLEQVRGIYIKPKEGSNGLMLATDLENTALLLYARGRYEEDPTIIRDTTYMVYNLYLDPDLYDLDAGGVSINSVKHDFSSSKVDTEELLTTCYVDGMGGVVTEVEFTDAFIQDLADIVTSAGKNAVVSVNQAMMSVYLEGSDYDYNILEPGTITPILNASMSRLGCYTSYNRLIAITDYMYTVETSKTKLNYDGYLNRSLACYKMDISIYLQSLINAASDYVDESGKVDFEKFASDDDYMSLRRFYLAPEAYSLYGFKRQAIYGMDGEVNGQKCVAPIKLELTYTIVD